MAVVSPNTGHLNIKIVYSGPAMAGKTTNLQFIHARTSPEKRGNLIRVKRDDGQRFLHFDMTAGALGRFRLLLQTAPGPIFYESIRTTVLRGADAVVFVADSQEGRADANVDSLKELGEDLKACGLDIKSIPIALQYNKRDLPDALPVAELDASLNAAGWPRFEGIARTGVGVVEPLQAILSQLRRVPPREGAA